LVQNLAHNYPDWTASEEGLTRSSSGESSSFISWWLHAALYLFL
jgi:hypothetical protein